MPGGVELATAYVTLKADGSRLPGEAAALGARSGKAYSAGFGKSTISTERALERIGRTSKRVFLAGAVGIAYAEKKAADYNAQMATVFTLAHANTRQQAQLAKAAKTVGVNIGYSATKTGQAEEELVKAGVSVRDMLSGGLKGALDLAAAGQTGVASATEVAASAMTQFSLKGRDVPHIADLLAAGADKALGSVTDLGYGLSQAGTTAHQMNLSIEDTVGTLAEFAQNGLIGERSGTTLKMMLLRLANPTKKSSDLMDQYGLSIYKANGQLKTMPEIAGQLQKSFKDLDPAQRNAALGTIFGSRAIQAANILIKDGEAGNRKWIKSVNDQGFAAHQAAGKMDSLRGDAQKLNAQLENAFINASGKQSFLRMLAQDASKLLKGYNKLSDAQRELINKTAVKAVAGAGIVWAATKVYGLAKSTAEIYGAIFKTKAASTAVGALGGKAGGVTPVYVTNWAGAAGVTGAAAGGAGAAEGAVAGAAASRAATAKMVLGKVAITAGSVILAGQIAKGITGLLDSVLPRNPKENTDPLFKGFDQDRGSDSLFNAKNRNTLKSSLDAVIASKGGGGLNGYGIKSSTELGKLFTFGQFNAIGDDEKRIRSLDSAIADLTNKKYSDGQDAFNQVLAKTGLKASEVNKALPKTADALSHITTAADRVAAADWWNKVSGGSVKASAQLAKYSKTLDTVPKEIRSYVSTPGAVHSLDEMRRIAKQYHLTPKQIRTIMLLQGYSQTQARIAAAGKAFQRLPKDVRTRLRADTVKTMADVLALQKRYHLTPKQVHTVVTVSGIPQAIAQARALRNEIAAIKSKSVFITIHKGNAATGAPTGPYTPKAGARGMTVPGRRTPYGDKVFSFLAPGEEVISNRYGQADRHRGLLKAINSNRMAGGGTVGGRARAVGGGGWPSSMTLVVGDREFEAYIEEVADGRVYAVTALENR